LVGHLSAHRSRANGLAHGRTGTQQHAAIIRIYSSLLKIKVDAYSYVTGGLEITVSGLFSPGAGWPLAKANAGAIPLMAVFVPPARN
jgi:hypothetical protein